MRLNAFTDYCLRTLIFLAVHPETLATRAQIATAYGISDNHLMKVVHFLGKLGYIDTLKGRGGGIRLAKPIDQIGIGALVRHCEEDAPIVECFETTGKCRIDGMCSLKGILAEAREAMYQSLDRYSLADLTPNHSSLAKQLSVAAPLSAKLTLINNR